MKGVRLQASSSKAVILDVTDSIESFKLAK
jgi:hypothetical protein